MTKPLRLISALLCSILLSSASFAQAEKQKIAAYLTTYKDLAIREMLRTGVPAAVTLAQGILETGGGQSALATLAYNHFGIKCKSKWTGQTISRTDDHKNECFRKYASVEDSYKDHSDFLRTRPGYAFLFKLDPTDYEGWAKGLKRAGYATNPAYAQKLIKLIVDHNLQDYTLLALNGGNTGEEIFTNGNNTGNNSGVRVTTFDETGAVTPTPPIKVVTEKTKSVTYPVDSVFSINNLKVIYAKVGTSLLALAYNYNISYKKLLEYNEFDHQSEILNSAQLIFLEKKSKKSTKEIHIVAANETLRDISQKEGMQLATIMEYNGLQKGMQPAQGEKIYLQYSAPSSPRLATSGSLKTVASK